MSHLCLPISVSNRIHIPLYADIRLLHRGCCPSKQCLQLLCGACQGLVLVGLQACVFEVDRVCQSVFW